MSVLYPDGTHIHRDTHGPGAADEHYKKLYAEHITKNQAYALIVDSLPAHMKKTTLDSDGDAVLDGAGQPKLTVKDKHRPRFEHTGGGHYTFAVPGIDEAAYAEIAARLAEFGDRVTLRKPNAWAAPA